MTNIHDLRLENGRKAARQRQRDDTGCFHGFILGYFWLLNFNNDQREISFRLSPIVSVCQVSIAHAETNSSNYPMK
jgi:hypothetical protein